MQMPMLTVPFGPAGFDAINRALAGPMWPEVDYVSPPNAKASRTTVLKSKIKIKKKPTKSLKSLESLKSLKFPEVPEMPEMRETCETSNTCEACETCEACNTCEACETSNTCETSKTYEAWERADDYGIVQVDHINPGSQGSLGSLGSVGSLGSHETTAEDSSLFCARTALSDTSDFTFPVSMYELAVATALTMRCLGC